MFKLRMCRILKRKDLVSSQIVINNSINYITKLQLFKTMALVTLNYDKKNRDILYISITVIAVFLVAMLASILNDTTLNHHMVVTDVYAQPYVETVKHRNLTIDLGNGLKTNAQLTIPAVGGGQFPGVIIFPGAGAGSVLPPTSPYSHLAKYLSERGFAVLRYDKRGVGPNFTISDSNAWGNLTFNNLKQDAEKAISVLLQQPEVNASKKATLIGHSEGSNIPPRVAVDIPDKVRNIVLMSPVAEKWTDIIYFQEVAHPLLYAESILAKGHLGLISVKEASKDPIFQTLVGGNLTQLLLNKSSVTGNNVSTSHEQNKTNADLISIEKELKPALVRFYENDTSPTPSQLSAKCIDIFGCPSEGKSFSALSSVNSMIGNVSSNIGVLVLVGKNDSQTPLEQASLLQQRLTEVNHPDHLMIVYPGLGHSFAHSNQWVDSHGPMEEYVFQDIYEWLTSPARHQ
jgi:alpha-beta hydrolase superfamily lysophospholipase